MLINRIFYWLCFALVGFEILYGFYWAIPNIGLRLGIWPEAMNPGLAELIATLNFWQEAAFFGHIGLNIIALIALSNRSAACIPAFIVAFLLDRIDWIILGLNPASFGVTSPAEDWVQFISSFGGIGLTAMLQMLCIALMASFLFNGQLSTHMKFWRARPRRR
ncbi:hypothetical protein [Maricaulis sp.]|uniref:hypothetical protein n=1 Tax=Maricaulis sp. TaxID=1486257 RepID=UPI0026381D10|nr:hypothetical protein [Maricaulis sp.]